MTRMRDAQGRFVKAGAAGAGATAGVQLTGQWDIAVQLTKNAPANFDRAADMALKRIAIDIEGRIKDGYAKGVNPAQKKTTRATGGTGKPLSRDGDLAAAPNVVGAGHLAYFVGVPRSSGEYSVAAIHEEGALVVQEMSERMRKFLHARLSSVGPAPPGGGGRFVVSQIPARPVIGPAFDEVHKDFAANFQREFSAALGGQYGR